MEIITLIENNCCDERLDEEFGLSLLIKSNGGNILFDMGATALFNKNAEILGEDLPHVDCAVVSHAHYDHGGGLGEFGQINDKALIYVGKNADGNYFGNMGVDIPPFLQPLLYPLVVNRSLFCHYIGLDKAVLRGLSDRIVPIIEDFKQILENVYLVSAIEKNNPLAEGNKFLLEQKGDTFQSDGFEHELIMVIREEDGLALFTGCGHCGILNMVRTVQDTFKGEKIKAVIGGFHLAMRPGKPAIAGKEEDIVAIAQAFIDAGVEKVVTGHCTGDDACSILRYQLGERFSRLATGSRHMV